MKLLLACLLTIAAAIVASQPPACAGPSAPDATSYTYDGAAVVARTGSAAVTVPATGHTQHGLRSEGGSTDPRSGHFYDSSGSLLAPRPGVLVDGAGSGTRTINFRPNAADPNWGLTPTHLDKHLFGSGPHSLSTIDSAGNPALWADYIQDLAGRRVTSTTSNGMQDIIGTFPLADGSGTFQFGIRLSPNTDGTFDLITLLTRQ